MTKIERAVFLKLHADELKAQKDAIEQYNNLKANYDEAIAQ